MSKSGTPSERVLEKKRHNSHEVEYTAFDNSLREVLSMRSVLEQITHKWSVLILTILCTRPTRFNELMRRLDGITHKGLADALKRLERNGLVRREVLPTAPVGVEYSITPLGNTLKQPFLALCDWALAYAPEVETAQAEYDGLRD